MTKAEMLAEIAGKQFAMKAELAERRQRREASGEAVDDLLRRTASNVKSTLHFDVDAAIEDQLWQQRQYRTQPQPQQSQPNEDDQLVTLRMLEQFADVIGEEAGRDTEKLKREITELRAEIEILKGGNITPIGKRTHNAA